MIFHFFYISFNLKCCHLQQLLKIQSNFAYPEPENPETSPLGRILAVTEFFIVFFPHIRVPFYWHVLVIIPAWINNYNYSRYGMKNSPIPKSQRQSRWSLKKDKKFHPTLHCACNYLSVQWLKLNHISNRDPGKSLLSYRNSGLGL